MKVAYKIGNRTLGVTLNDRMFFLPDYSDCSQGKKEYSKPKLTKYSNNTIRYLDNLSKEDILSIKPSQRIRMINIISNMIYFEEDAYKRSSKMLEEICQDKTLQEKIYNIIGKEREEYHKPRKVFRVEIK